MPKESEIEKLLKSDKLKVLKPNSAASSMTRKLVFWWAFATRMGSSR